MLKLLSRFRRAPRITAFPAPAPADPFYAIGDIHGRADLLDALLADIDPGLPVICVGDYVDRGDASAAVLRRLADRPDITCLMGNHERMLLDFLDAPERSGRRWLRYGGLQTLASFGIRGIVEGAKTDALCRARDALETALGPDLLFWLASLPAHHRNGNIAIVHAGADPTLPVAGQDPEVLIWGHPAFATTPRSDGIWVVHGHTIVDEPSAIDGRIAIDTGAYATNRLTAARIDESGIRFFSTR